MNMNSTDTRHELKLVERHTEVSDRLYGGRSNSYFTDDRSRVLAADVQQNVHGEYVASIGAGRTVDYAGNAVEFYGDHGAYRHSPVYDGIEDARQWAAEALAWALDSMVSSYTVLSPFPLDAAPFTYCGSCGHFGTLTAAQEAWADVITCSTDGCTYENRISIGD